MLVDRLHYSFHQHVVVAFHLNFLHLVGLSLCAGVFSANASYIVHEVVDLYVQFLDAERFGDKGVGTSLQSLKPVGHVSLGCKQDYRDVADVCVRLYGSQQLYSVHLRHHHVGYYDVETCFSEQFLQSLFAVLTYCESVISRKLVLNVLCNFLVIVNNKHSEVL